MKISEIKPQVIEMAGRAQAQIRPEFDEIDRVALLNTQKVMEAFQDHRVSEACFAGTTGYGYDDLGRETLDRIYAQVFGAESALVRTQFVNGTHALTCAMFSLASPGETVLAVTGTPYDTLRCAIGISGDGFGSLRSYGIGYGEVALNAEGRPDLDRIREAASDPKVRGVMLQRSRGYEDRPALTIEDIRQICLAVREVNPSANIMVDNCYGEFTGEREPLEAGADMIVGSLIKNPGGGLAPIGGYIVGKKECIENAAYRLTSPGLGKEVGASLSVIQSFYQGLFLAPYVTASALKGAVFAANIYEKLGFKVIPGGKEERYDIIQAVELGSPERLIAFCRGIQSAAPVDSFVVPEPWDMPGYDSKVIMAAGAFVSGSSIELSADGPLREPYTVFFQGGLTWAHAKLGILKSLQCMKDEGLVTV